MKSLLLAVCFLISVTCYASEFDAIRISQEELNWQNVADGIWIAKISGDENSKGLYVFRVKLRKGIKSDRHFHHDVKVGTILSGSLYIGFMDSNGTWSEKKLGVGGVYTEPNKLPHYIWSKDEDVIVQIVGYGPTSKVPVE